jgi:hypothetical protein
MINSSRLPKALALLADELEEQPSRTMGEAARRRGCDLRTAGPV